ncbi:MAG TPA: hypothetical protein VF656_09350 [Pyrinomonadaceae bacterium]
MGRDKRETLAPLVSTGLTGGALEIRRRAFRPGERARRRTTTQTTLCRRWRRETKDGSNERRQSDDDEVRP